MDNGQVLVSNRGGGGGGYGGVGMGGWWLWGSCLVQLSCLELAYSTNREFPTWGT